MEGVRCPSCGWEVPPGRFCVRCGQPLDAGAAARTGRGGRFAAAPRQRATTPALVSTLFPQLPDDGMAIFRGALAIGLAVVVGLSLAGLFTIALVAAAVLVPMVTVLYFVDVDVYEEQPRPVLALTLGSGALAGVAIALLASALDPGSGELVTRSDASAIPLRGVLIPLLSLALALAGPLVLLRRPRFNDVLDGTTFGAAGAAALAGAQVIVQSLPFLGSGASPAGAVGPWTFRLATLAIGVPVLAMACAGALAGTLWLRFRAPADRRAGLGPLRAVPAAATCAGALMVAGAIAQILLRPALALIAVAVLGVAAVLWLRRLIHLGLLQEAAEIPIGPEVPCPNCGRQTHRHTFCEHCGVSLRALPKAARRPPPSGLAAEPGA